MGLRRESHIATSLRHQLPMPSVEGVDHRFVEARGATFHIAEAGDGPPLILLHGWPQHWWSWREVIPSLAERYRVICPDIRGLGWSSGSEGSYRWEDLGDDLIALMDALRIDRARLIGHDWGVVAGYRACINHPERFERYVALAALHMWQWRNIRLIALRRPWHIWALAVLGEASLTRLNLGERVLRTWRYDGEFSGDEVAVYSAALRRPCSLRASVRFNRNVALRELPHALRNCQKWHMKVPTLHLLGEHDPITPFVPHNYRTYAPQMRLERITRCGHYIPEEAPHQLLEYLEEFL